MTAQFPDRVRYLERDFELVGVKGDGLYHPQEHGLEPQGYCSACWRGFVCRYAIDGERLVLDTLWIYLEGEPPVLLGKEPLPDDDGCGFSAVYEELAHPVAFTGGFLVADDFIRDLYVHMGFHPAWKYREVHELIFEGGRLVSARDCSDRLSDVRAKMTAEPLEPDLDDETTATDWVADAFQLKWFE